MNPPPPLPVTRVIVSFQREARSDYGTSVNTQDGPLYHSVNCCNPCERSRSAAFWVLDRGVGLYLACVRRQNCV